MTHGVWCCWRRRSRSAIRCCSGVRPTGSGSRRRRRKRPKRKICWRSASACGSAIRSRVPPSTDRRRRRTAGRSTSHWRRRPTGTSIRTAVRGIWPLRRRDPTRRSPLCSSVPRVERALVAAQANLQAGAFDAALGLLAAAEAGPIQASQGARVELLRAEIAFASRGGSAAPALLLRAAQRIEPFDMRLARSGYIEALSAAMFAARFAGPGSGARDVASAVQAAPPAASPRTVADDLLGGWAGLFADGCAAATPTLQAGLAHFEHAMAAADQLHLLWLVKITAPA